MDQSIAAVGVDERTVLVCALLSPSRVVDVAVNLFFSVPALGWTTSVTVAISLAAMVPRLHVYWVQLPWPVLLDTNVALPEVISLVSWTFVASSSPFMFETWTV